MHFATIFHLCVHIHVYYVRDVQSSKSYLHAYHGRPSHYICFETICFKAILLLLPVTCCITVSISPRVLPLCDKSLGNYLQIQFSIMLQAMVKTMLLGKVFYLDCLFTYERITQGATFGTETGLHVYRQLVSELFKCLQ